MTLYRFNTTGARFAMALMAVSALIPQPSYADESSFQVSAGYDYSSGKYGQAVTTSIETLPVSMNYINGPWSLALSVPYIRITGNGTVIPGAGGPTTFNNFGSGLFGGGMGGGSSSTQTITNSGMGDITASMGYGFFPASGNFYELSAKVKFGTADVNTGLGTGENDYYLQYDAVLGGDSVSPFFTLGYVITGDSASYIYKDVPYASLGLIFKTGQSSSFGVSYDYRQATVDGSDALQQANLFISWSSSKQWTTTLSALTGFTDSSPDVGVGLIFSRSY